MTIAKHLFTGILVAIASGYIKLLERIYRRWQLKSCSNLLTRVTTLSTCTTGVDTGVESESPPKKLYKFTTPQQVLGLQYNGSVIGSGDGQCVVYRCSTRVL